MTDESTKAGPIQFTSDKRLCHLMVSYETPSGDYGGAEVDERNATEADLLAAGYVPQSELADVSELGARVCHWARKHYLFDKGLPEELHEFEEALRGYSDGNAGEAYKSLTLRRAETAESALAASQAEVQRLTADLESLATDAPSELFANQTNVGGKAMLRMRDALSRATAAEEALREMQRELRLLDASHGAALVAENRNLTAKLQAAEAEVGRLRADVADWRRTNANLLQESTAEYGKLLTEVERLRAEARHGKRLLSDVINGLDGDNWQSEVEMLINGMLASAAPPPAAPEPQVDPVVVPGQHHAMCECASCGGPFIWKPVVAEPHIKTSPFPAVAQASAAEPERREPALCDHCGGKMPLMRDWYMNVLVPGKHGK